eukprot:gene1545-1884_t
MSQLAAELPGGVTGGCDSDSGRQQDASLANCSFDTAGCEKGPCPELPDSQFTTGGANSSATSPMYEDDWMMTVVKAAVADTLEAHHQESQEMLTELRRHLNSIRSCYEDTSWADNIQQQLAAVEQ